MVLRSGIWQVTVPPQYYESKVIYSLTVSDLSGYTLTIKDSTYIKYIQSSSKPYQGNNLTLSAFLSPVNASDNLCAPDYAPVTAILSNFGENDYDLSQDSIVLRLEITDPYQTKYSETISMNTGIFESERSDIIVLMPALPIMYAGQYDIKAWLESPIDNISYDDTITYLYTSGRIGLPLDDNFSNGVLSSYFISDTVIGSDVWMPYTNPSSSVQPDFGTGMLRYVGQRGSVARLTTRQIELSGVVNPKLEFWYYHDTTASDLDKSYTDVNIIENGQSTHVLTLFRKDTPHGWEQYTIPLGSYTNSECVIIEFVSTNRFGVQSAQYIDRIFITSEPDLAVSEIIISPEVSVCDLENKTLSVVLDVMTRQAIDFSTTPIDLVVETPNSTYTVPLQGVMIGKASETISITSNYDFGKGLHNIKAYLKTPVGSDPLNDTATRVIDIDPDLSVTVNSLTGGNFCFKAGTSVQQEIVLRNTGNMDLSGIELVLYMQGDNSTETVYESQTINIAAGDTVLYTFTESYTVPEEARYQVQVTANLGCNPTLVSNSHATNECADMHNLSIVSVNNPPRDSIGIRGSTDSITVSIKNIDDLNSFDNVSIIAVIESEQGQTLFSRLGTIPTVSPSSSIPFTFPESYTVPNDSVYYIKVYLNKVDIYPEDDTLRVPRNTRKGGDNNIVTEKNSTFTLAQNIPNPASHSTRIDYSLSEAGEVIFHVHSISGQLLYSQTIEASRGTNSIELNTSTFAAGVYVYSMEYKGQRLVRQLIISN
jgi:hypothetical protein